MTGNDEPDGSDVVAAARSMVRTVGEAHGAVAGDAPTLEREVRGPTTCSDEDAEDDTYRASVHWTVVLDEDTDVEALLADLRDQLQDQGIDAGVRHLEGPQPRVQARGEDEIGYAAEVVREVATLHWLASTPCLPIPDDYDDVNDLDPEFRDLVDPDGETVEADLEGSLAERAERLREEQG